MNIKEIQAKTVLNKQTHGFLVGGFTHAVNPYRGCSMGCNYCYAAFLPGWVFHNEGDQWGQAVHVKNTFATQLKTELLKIKPAKRADMRIFFGSATESWQPLEATRMITRQALEVLLRFPEVGVVMQTRSTLARRDFDLMQQHPRLVLSVTIETDNQNEINVAHAGGLISDRFKMVRLAADMGIPTQIVVSPCLPYSDQFADLLLDSPARAIVIDSFVAGDGSMGARTSQSQYVVHNPQWRDEKPAHLLFQKLNNNSDHAKIIGWSARGFSALLMTLTKRPTLFNEGDV